MPHLEIVDLAIVGLERSGKTTIFNALTRGHAQTGGYAGLEPHLGTVKVPDERLDRLCERFTPKRITHAEVRYIDFPGAGFSKDKGPAPQYLGALSGADALIHVVRLFENPAVPHPGGSIDVQRDLHVLDMELALADLAMIERRLDRLEAELRALKAGERERGDKERALLQRFQQALKATNRCVKLRFQRKSAGWSPDSPF